MMADSYNMYTGDGSTTVYPITYDQEVFTENQVYINDVLQTSGYTYDSGQVAIVFSTAPVAGAIIRLQRFTDLDLLYKFGQGAAFTGQHIDENFEQVLSKSQETQDIVEIATRRTLRVPSTESSVNLLPTIDNRKGKVLGFDADTGQPVALLPGTGTATDVLLQLANTANPAQGDALIGVMTPAAGAVARTLHSKVLDVISVADFGAVSGGGQADAHTNSKAFQLALSFAYLLGGAKVVTDGGDYFLDYPIYLRDNTELDLCGSTITFLNPTFNIGRGGIVIGSSYEANRTLALAAYAAGTYPGATTINTAYVNPALKQYLRDNPSFREARNCRVHSGHLTALHTVGGGNGGYAVNFVNAEDSYAYNLTFDGWTQAIGMGSDGSPETPSNHNCHAFNLVINTGDLVKTFYSIGFISNSTACTIESAIQIKPLTAGTPNGSACATNYVEDCHFRNITVINLGRTVSSEGILLNNAKGSSATNIHIGNAVSAVSTYYTDASFNDPAKPNHIADVYANNCDYAFSTRAKYAIIDNVSAVNCIGDVFFGNNNASDNVFNFVPKAMVFGGSNFPSSFLTLNTVKGWRYQYAYLRPGNILVNDRADLASVTSTKVVGAKVGVNLSFSYQLPSTMKAVNDVRMFLTFNTGALTAGSNMAITLRRMLAYDGNLGETPYVEMTNNRTATSDTLTDTSLVAQVSGTSPGYVLAADTTHGLANAWELYITATNNVQNNYVKEIRIGYWGD